ncbi:hypothetical protein LTR70_007669 [Exophiala xenobiotica]|uniref:Uncharacterized protein n=1 Tax=Lithohypha guttulata TaxID=1690604 RepID=A0ABR0K1G1_9EURO|nr:hypothetical protein LTR24_007938 [Lithohypha guttulata]KAK5313365.1 hypothetical protein LTR70_007669 [Exophiala xenobiotica]
MLLEKGADINAQGGEHDGNALQLASAGGDEKVVQMLFDTGAEASVTQEQVPEWEFYGLKPALRKGVLITLIRELEVDTDTVYRSWHQVSKEGPKFLSAKNFRLLPWKKKN